MHPPAGPGPTSASPRADVGSRRGPSAPPALTVCVVTYRSADTITACLEALRAAAVRHTIELIVVDNASDDDTLGLVATAWPEVRILANPGNSGFARANNQAIELAAGRHVLLLNPDTAASPGSLDALVDHLDAHPEVGVVAPRLRNPDGTDQGTARAFPTPAAALFGRRSPLTRWFPDNPWATRYLVGAQHPDDVPFDVDWVSGACLLVRGQAIADAGPLDPGYFMYWEDADWCRRIKAHGWRVTCVPTADVIHHEGAARAGWPVRRVSRFHRSAYRYYATHHLGGVLAVLRPLAAAVLLLRALAVLLMTRRSAADPTPAGTNGGSPTLNRAVVASTAGQLAAKVVHFAVNIVSSVAIIRYLAPAEFGRYVLVMTVAVILGLIANFGLDKLAIREAVRSPEHEDAIVGTTIVARLLLAVVAAALVQITLAAFQASAELHVAGGVISLLFVAEALLTVAIAFHVRVQQQWEAGARIVGEAIETALVLWLVTHAGSLIALVAAPVVGLVAAVAVAATAARRRFGLRPRFEPARLRPLMRTALSVGPALLAGVLFLRLDSLMVAALRPREDVGIYGAAFQPIEYLLLASAVFVNVVFPILAATYRVEVDRFRTLFRSTSELLIGAALLVPLVATVSARTIVPLVYGDAFTASAGPLTVLSWALVPLVATAWMSFVLMAVDRERTTLRLNGLAIGVSAVANLLLIPPLGTLGAATATLMTATVIVGLQVRVVREVTGASLDATRLVRLATAAAATLALALVARTLGLADLLAAVLVVVTYPLALTATGSMPPARLLDAARTLRQPALLEGES